MTVRLKQSGYANRLALQAAASGNTGNKGDRAFAITQQALVIFAISIVLFAAAILAMPGASNTDTPLEQEAAAAAVASANFENDNAPVAPQASSKAVDAPQSGTLTGTTRQQQAVTTWLSRRYKVAGDAADMLVSTAYLTAKELKLDPLLILSVMAIESGLNPFAESPVGAKGLMQVMAHVHQEKFRGLGGVKAALNPVANIKVGSAILKEYVTRGGSIEAGLKSYVGAAAFETDDGYGHRVLAEYRRLKDVSSGKDVPIRFPALAKRPVAPAPAIVNPAKELEAHVEPEVKPETVAAL
ncbi:MAG TPA: lytic transglycosylase domain-containing protein [Burkholderiaceae bacterium]